MYAEKRESMNDMKEMWKKIIAVVLSLALLPIGDFGIVNAKETNSAESAIHKSAQADLTISSVREYYEFAKTVCDGVNYSGEVIRLTADIDFKRIIGSRHSLLTYRNLN